MFAIFCTPCMVIDPRRKRFGMSMQLRQCFARAKPIRLKITTEKARYFWLLYFQKKPKVLKKPEFWNLASKKPNWQPCYTRIENAHKVRKKTQFFLEYRSPENLVFLFPLLRHYEMPESFYVKNCCFKLVQQFYHATKFGNVANAVSTWADPPQQTK